MRAMNSHKIPASVRRRICAHPAGSPATYSLLAHHAPTGTFAWRQGRAYSVQEFLRSAWTLAARLPEKRYAINVCKDRYFFAVGFAASLIARQISLLPTCRAEEPLRELAQRYPDAYILSDHDEVMNSMPLVRLTEHALQGTGSAENPSISASRIAAIAFTSGSSGTPQAHAKSWGSLVMGARALGRQFDLQDKPSHTAVGTVPAQHMYGLETTIMLPFQWGWSLYAGCSVLPADLRMDLEHLSSPAWLMTTPFHLNAYLNEQVLLPGLESVISATMPLARAVAQGAEALWHVPVHEIYGCTEGGILASRHTTAGDQWTLCHDLRIRQREDTTWVMGGHVGAWLQLTDRIQLRGRREFLLLGPHHDLVKIAGKRASLTALNNILRQVPGVLDGIFYRGHPERAHNGRLCVFVVAPGVTRATILAHLRKRIDPVFLPRPLYFVDTLPRNATGKLPCERLEAFIEHFRRPGLPSRG